ncbi:extracellular solute-binding protein [Zooshikella ganghwensis]|nr:extracellular solute-binding protein [Zooshikella ganghwensis]
MHQQVLPKGNISRRYWTTLTWFQWLTLVMGLYSFQHVYTSEVPVTTSEKKITSTVADTTIKVSAIALHGEPKYPDNFKHFSYVNPSAPKGGKITLSALGTFDTLNPYTLKGTSPVNTPGFYVYGINENNETLLMGTTGDNRVGDEYQTAYGLIAEYIEFPSNYEWVIFHIRPEARFHNDTPITAQDVVFSFNTLIKKGHPRYKLVYTDVKDASAVTKQQVKFLLSGDSRRSLILRLGELPVLSATYWADRDFAATTLEPPLNSGPYRMTKVEPGRSITFERDEQYWGKSLAINQGRYNFDRVEYIFFQESTVAFEAFKASQYDFRIEHISKQWETSYSFPAVHSGKVLKVVIPHREPASLQGFFLNSRHFPFNDIAAREAIAWTFDFEWTNKVLFYDAYQRSHSLFANSDLGSFGPPTPEERKLLSEFKLPSHIKDKAFKLPNIHDGTIRDRQRIALKRLRSAGWRMQQGKLVNAQGKPFTFEALEYQQSSSRILLPLQKNLKRIGIDMRIRIVDSASYQERLKQFDFDMTTLALSQSLAPGQNLKSLYHSSQATTPGSLNLSGIQLPPVDQLLTMITKAHTREELQLYTRSLDRILLWHYFIIPHWHLNYHRVAYWKHLQRPAMSPPYSFCFECWWVNDQ